MSDLGFQWKPAENQLRKKGVYEISAQNIYDLQIVTGFFVPGCLSLSVRAQENRKSDSRIIYAMIIPTLLQKKRYNQRRRLQKMKLPTRSHPTEKLYSPKVITLSTKKINFFFHSFANYRIVPVFRRASEKGGQTKTKFPHPYSIPIQIDT